MDVVDGQIVDTLLRLDPNFFDGLPEIPSTVTEIDTETLYQAIVTLLWACKPSTKKEIPSRLFPQNMSAKFRCAMSVVDVVKSLGVRDPIDYHMLLYGRSKELRNVLIGIMEKLPKDSAVITSAEDPLTDLIRSAVHINESKPNQRGWYNSFRKRSWDSPGRVEFRGFCGDILAALRYDDYRYCQTAVICSLLENNAVGNGSTQNYQSLTDGILDTVQTEHRTLSNKRVKPQLKRKPVLPAEPQKKPAVNMEQGTGETASEDIEKNEIIDKLHNEIMTVSASVGCKRISESKLRSDEVERLATLQRKKLLEAKIDGRLKKLLQDPDAVAKLENFTDGSDERMQHLQNLWLKAKTEKDEEVNMARLAASSSEYALLYRNREALQKGAEAAERELAGKKMALEKLRKQMKSREEKQINRSIYTKHIFDIVSNIKKQQDEINKIAVENQRLQKEIKSTAGKLDRTFAVVEGRLYKDVEKDTFMQKAYRLLMKIHGECSWVITAIDSSGQLGREIEKLNDQIAMQQQKKTDEKLENVVNDWMEVKKENTSLKKSLTDCDNS